MPDPIRQIDRFAELLAEHVTPEDARRAGVRPNKGGNCVLCARKLGLADATGNGMLQRMRRDLGPQAR